MTSTINYHKVIMNTVFYIDLFFFFILGMGAFIVFEEYTLTLYIALISISILSFKWFNKEMNNVWSMIFLMSSFMFIGALAYPLL